MKVDFSIPIPIIIPILHCVLSKSIVCIEHDNLKAIMSEAEFGGPKRRDACRPKHVIITSFVSEVILLD